MILRIQLLANNYHLLFYISPFIISYHLPFQDMGVLQAKCLAELKSLQTMKCEADFIDILNDYRQRQQDLVRRRQLERDSVTDKLKKTLSKRGVDGDSEPSVEQMDEVFYSDICRRQQELPLSEAALGSLIDNHLDRVDSFEKRVKDEVLQRRLQRTGNDERKVLALRKSRYILLTQKNLIGPFNKIDYYYDCKYVLRFIASNSLTNCMHIARELSWNLFLFHS